MSKVSIIISNRNDIAMLAVTVRSVIEELRPLGPGRGEIVIADNSDRSIFDIVKAAIPSGYCRDGLVKIVRQPFPCLFSARELAARESSGDYILCLDSHMLVGRDGILELTNFMDRHSDDKDLGFAHAPISWAHQHESRAKHDRDMSRSELGPWGTRYYKERTITWKGMPWICRKEWFLNNTTGLGGYGSLSKHHISWGGGDMHIGVKPWMLGFKNWAVPTNPFVHIGPFPKLDINPKNPNEVEIVKEVTNQNKYRLYNESGNYPHAFGFLVSCYVLGGEPMMRRNKDMIKDRFGRFINVELSWKKAIELGQEEKDWLDARKKYSFEELLAARPWDGR